MTTNNSTRNFFLLFLLGIVALVALIVVMNNGSSSAPVASAPTSTASPTSTLPDYDERPGSAPPLTSAELLLIQTFDRYSGGFSSLDTLDPTYGSPRISKIHYSKNIDGEDIVFAEIYLEPQNGIYE